MTLTEILQTVSGLSSNDRALLRRELDEMMSKHEMAAPSSTLAEIEKDRQTCGAERGLPIEDVLESPQPK